MCIWQTGEYYLETCENIKDLVAGSSLQTINCAIIMVNLDIMQLIVAGGGGGGGGDCYGAS